MNVKIIIINKGKAYQDNILTLFVLHASSYARRSQSVYSNQLAAAKHQKEGLYRNWVVTAVNVAECIAQHETGYMTYADRLT